MAKPKPKRQAAPSPAPAAASDGIDRFMIMEALIAGVSPEVIVAELAGSGIPASSARFEVERAAKSPYLGVAARLSARVAKRDWVLGSIAALDALNADALSIPVIDQISAEDFFGRFYNRNRPVLLTGLVSDWPATSKWSFDYLEAAVGDAAVGVQWGRESNPDYEAQCGDHKAFMPMRDVISRIRSGASNDFYVTANNADVNRDAFAPLYRDVGTVAGLLESQSLRDGYIWVGPQGTITPWHHDLSNNLLMMFVGRKRIRLVAAHDTRRMRNTRHCFTDWSAEDLLPGAGSDVTPPVLECIVGPGEALFIPVGWWHHVEALDATIGMTFLNFAAPNDFQSGYDCYDRI
jgi:Cupin-like domain